MGDEFDDFDMDGLIEEDEAMMGGGDEDEEAMAMMMEEANAEANATRATAAPATQDGGRRTRESKKGIDIDNKSEYYYRGGVNSKTLFWNTQRGSCYSCVLIGSSVDRFRLSPLGTVTVYPVPDHGGSGIMFRCTVL